MRKKWLLLSFVEGAAVMGAELCGARLMAPIFGSSLYVWATVMGFTLLALAAGYFFGGRISSKTKSQEKSLRTILSLAALVLMAMPLMAYYLVPRLSYLAFSTGMILSAALILLPAVFLLGASSPLFVLLQVDDQKRSGEVSGTVYAVSTSGGILSTFLCGFYLIPDLGLTTTLLLFGILLFALNAFVFKTFKIFEVIVGLFILYLNYQVLSLRTSTLETSDSILGTMKVFDLRSGNKTIRYMSINDIIQTEMILETQQSNSDYVHLLDTLIADSRMQGKALVLGLGGGLTANMLVKKKYETIGVEFDERISKSAKKYFNLSPSVISVNEDARQFLNNCTAKYDVILADLFKAEEQPSHVLTLESLDRLKKNLTSNGILYITWHGYLSGEKSKGTSILLETLHATGFKLNICSMGSDQDHRNLIIVASEKQQNHLAHQLAFNAESTELLNTDDCPRLEKYNATANKSWRTSYLRYYQGIARQ